MSLAMFTCTTFVSIRLDESECSDYMNAEHDWVDVCVYMLQASTRN